MTDDPVQIELPRDMARRLVGELTGGDASVVAARMLLAALHPEPEKPRYEAIRTGDEWGIYKDVAESRWCVMWIYTSHPDPRAAAEAEAARLNGESDDALRAATTRELLIEVAERMKTTQNSIKGRELGGLCSEACRELDKGVLDRRRAPARHPERSGT